MNIILKVGATIALSLAVSACGSSDGEPDAPAASETAAPAPAPKKKLPQTDAEVEKFHESFESAMAKIPPEMRAPFQKLFACEVKANNALPQAQQVIIDGDWIIAKTAELKANPSLANCTA